MKISVEMKLILKGIALIVISSVALALIFTLKGYMQAKVGMDPKVETFKGNHENVTVTYYFMEGCPHCRSMKPEWEKFKSLANGSNGTIVAKEVSADDDNGEITKANPKVSGFPTIHISKNGKVEEYNGKREASAIMAATKKMMA